MTRYFKQEPSFNGVHSRYNLPRTKDAVCVINLDDKQSKGTHWVYCIIFIKYVIAGKTLLDYTKLFTPNNHKKNEKIIYKYFRDKYDKRKHKP